MKLRYCTLLLACTLGVAHAKTIETDSFAIEWMDGYSRIAGDDSSKLQFASDDSGVTITVMGHSKTSAEEFRQLRELFVQYAEKELGKIAKRHGEIAIPLKREDLPSGAILFTLGGYDQRAEEFGLFFVHISAQGRASQVVVEGRGQPAARLPEFEKQIRTIRWKKEPIQSSQPTPGS